MPRAGAPASGAGLAWLRPQPAQADTAHKSARTTRRPPIDRRITRADYYAVHPRAIQARGLPGLAAMPPTSHTDDERPTTTDTDDQASPDDRAPPTARGAPLVATWGRWAAATAALAAALVVGLEVYVTLSRSERSVGSLSGALVGAGALLAAFAWVTLRAEELRLARELRTARTGTSALRTLVAGRRAGRSLWTRLLSTQLGQAAVLLADGDRSQALDVLAGGSPLMRGGRLERLRAVVEADLERAGGGATGQRACIERLRALPRVGNREADLYRTHVLVKASLELGDRPAGEALASDLRASRDDEERIYIVWLGAWFGFDGFEDGAGAGAGAGAGPGAGAGAGADAPAAAGAPPPRDTHSRQWAAASEGELRVAALLARAHGADQLVALLDARIASIARPPERA